MADGYELGDLREACESGDAAAVQAALLAGGDPDDPAERQSDGHRMEPPLLRAARKGYAEVVQLLVQRGGANVDASDKYNGNTALMRSASKGRAQVVRVLLGEGANTEKPDDNGRTALMYAAKHGDEASALALLDAGASVVAADHDGDTPMEYARMFGREESSKSQKAIIMLFEAWRMGFAAGQRGNAEK